MKNRHGSFPCRQFPTLCLQRLIFGMYIICARRRVHSECKQPLICISLPRVQFVFFFIVFSLSIASLFVLLLSLSRVVLLLYLSPSLFSISLFLFFSLSLPLIRSSFVFVVFYIRGLCGCSFLGSVFKVFITLSLCFSCFL